MHQSVKIVRSFCAFLCLGHPRGHITCSIMESCASFLRLPHPWMLLLWLVVFINLYGKCLRKFIKLCLSLQVSRDWPHIRKPYKETFREGAKQIHKELSTRNLGAVTKTFEEVITASITKLKEDIGPSGRMVPLHQTWFRIAYRGNMKAIFGPDLPVDETRVAVQTFASCIQALNTAPSLPILPYRWWNKLIPSARRGVKARSDLVDTLVKWQKEGGIESASSTWQNIMKVITDKNVPFDDATRWVNMVVSRILTSDKYRLEVDNRHRCSASKATL